MKTATLELPAVLVHAIEDFNFTGKPLWRIGEGLDHVKVELTLSVAWPTGVQLLVFFCSSVPVVLFDTPGISRCRSQHVFVESSSLLHRSIYL